MESRASSVESCLIPKIIPGYERLSPSEESLEGQTDTGDCPEELLLTETENTFPTGKTILSLPPEIIVEILLFCPEDVVNVAKALATKNQDIWNVIANKKLSKNAVIPPKTKYIEYLGSHTKSLHIEDKNTSWTVPRFQMKSITSRCSALERLTITNSFFFLSSAPLSKFPQSITHLKFANVSVVIRQDRPDIAPSYWSKSYQERVRKSPFFKIQVSLPNLKCLEVEAQEHCMSDVTAASLAGKYLLEGNKFTVVDFDHEELNWSSRIEYLSSQLERDTLIRRLQHIYMNR